MKKPVVVLGYPKIDHEKNYYYYWMPFATLAIAKVLLDEGLVDVVLFDGNQSSNGEWERLLDEHRGNVICIGLSIMTGGGQIGHALELATIAKNKSDIPIVFGGPHVNVLPDQTASHPMVDVVLQGPGQTSFPAYVEALLNMRPFETIPGLIINNGATIVRGTDNPPRTSKIGRYPWHLLDVESYVRDDPTIAPRTLNYVSSQGCVYKCRFCYELVYLRKYSAISSDDLLDDVEDLIKQFAIDGIKFYDADWFIDLRRAASFCRGLIDRELPIRWAASINPNDVLKARRLQPGLLSLMAKSGCTRLLMGVESGSDRVLKDIVDKQVTRAQILDVATEIAHHGIMGSYTFIIGFPGETSAEQEETFQLLDELRTLNPVPESRVHIFAPYPGTPLFEAAVAAGFTAPTSLEAWSDFNYYESQTPWTSEATAQAAHIHTHMRLRPDGSVERPMEIAS